MSLQIFISLLILFEINRVHSSPVLVTSNLVLPGSPVSLSGITPTQLISDSICGLQVKKIQLNLFAVNGLTSEDIQHGSQSNHPLLVDAKKDTSHFRYFPHVTDLNVYKTFTLIPQSNNMKCSHIQFKLGSHQVYDTLHDALNAMQSAMNSVGTDSKHAVVMALITGPVTAESSERRRRDDAKEDVLTSADTSCMFYVDKMRWTQQNGDDISTRTYSLDADTSVCAPNQTAGANNTVTLDLVWSNATTNEQVKVSLVVRLIGRYWNLISVRRDDLEYRYFAYGTHDTMTTPPTYSYVCNNAVFVKYNSTNKIPVYDFSDKFYITNLQFQPFNGMNGTQFGPPNYCTSFFTIGIWMGLTSSLLCLAILLFGIHRLMSIQSMDRFDDPKGKPLLIKAQE